ncbi:LL-diaminopimelate aminotransferase [Thermodesulfobium narugense DSM 14796]|uniref:Aminotransferase n=1 Tax=Thermodesulfobium narugense DSM 14796 TaxID=747365 RepID=M1E7P5_9BACT|nr:LL-diaminopimelate aminotransferase [Thermodesulfobium narugense]AEE14565.1 LL-diaminopimelate aminotransferase [Thermodesulfobium narugense DSM 14796]
MEIITLVNKFLLEEELKIRIAKRIQNVPPYLFSEIDKKKNKLRAEGRDLIDFGIGDPDLPTPMFVVNAMKEFVEDPRNHRYPPYEGTFSFRKTVSEWFLKRFNVSLDPDNEVMALIGSKEGIAHIPFSFVDEGDYTLVPNPSYPVYNVATILAGGKPYFMPINEENNFLPEFDKIPVEILEKTKILFLNYPNNPTGAVANLEFFEKAVYFAKKYDFLICHDMAYSEMTYDNYISPSLLQINGAKEVSVEFHSLSKMFNMTGWRVGFVVGSSQAIKALGIIKTNIDSGLFVAIQQASEVALRDDSNFIAKMNNIYVRRRNLLVSGLQSLGSDIKPPKGSFYLWVKTPKEFDASSFTERLMLETNIVVTPGSGYGSEGNKYVRFAITVSEDRIKEAIERMKSKSIQF